MVNKSNEAYQQALNFVKTNTAWIDANIPEKIKRREQALFTKLSKSKGNPFNKLKLLYKEIDVVFSSIENRTACHKGCSHCCRGDIAVSPLEIEYIKKNTKARLLSEDISISPENKFQACPFLQNNACSIYEFRPYVCRTHVSLAEVSRWCEHDVAFTHMMPILRFSQIDKAFAHINFPTGEPIMKDIRTVFARKNA